MGRTLLNTNTGMFGSLVIPYDATLGIQLAQAIVHHVFYKQRYPEFQCPLLKTDLYSEIHELFVDHEGLRNVPTTQWDSLINMGVGYMVSFLECLDELQKQHNREVIHLPQHSTRSDHVLLVI